MKNLNFLKLFFGTMLVLAVTALTSCVDDNDDTEAPYLEVSPANLVFTESGTPAEGSQSFFEISTNRHWTATVKDDKSWVTLSATEGDGSATIQVSIPEGINDEAKIDIQISNKVGPLMTETVTIKSGAVAPTTVIYNETVGSTAVSSPYPYVDAYTGWTKTGTGAANVTYSGQKATVRASGLSNVDAYPEASGPNVVFFGTLPADFVISNIELAAEQTNLKLTFGASYSFKPEGATDYDNTFDPSKFTVSLSSDGTSWVPLTYTKNNGDEKTPYWVLATANFTLKQATSKLYIKFTALAASAFRLDDITLSTGNGGDIIDLGSGSTDPEPEPTGTIYTETFGTTAASSSPYPFVDSFTGWDKSGTGAANVDYTGPGASVRQSGKLSAGYEGASGADKLFFGSNATFTINKIALTAAQTNLRLTFGASYSKNNGGVYDNVFKQDKFHFYLSADGTTWSDAIAYTYKQADEFWVFASSDFTLKNATSTLYIKYAADEASVFAIDDPTLIEGTGGQMVDLAGGGSSGGSTFDVTLTADEIAAMSNSAYAPFSFNNSFGAWSGKCAITSSGTDAPFLQINFNSDETKTAFNSYIQVPQQAGIVQKVVVTTSAKTFFPRYVLLCEAGYTYAAGSTQGNLDQAAKAKSNVSTAAGGTFTMENLEGLNLSQFSIFPGGGAVYINSITITYKRQ